MNISLENNIKDVLGSLTGVLSRDIPFAIKEALNDTLFEVRSAQPGRIESVFDKPVAFTKSVKAWEVEKANTGSLVGVLKMRPEQAEYLQWQIYGGTEYPDKRAIPIPNLKTAEGSGFRSTSGGLKRNWKSALTDDKYFSGKPKGDKFKDSPEGVYRRYYGAAKWNKSRTKKTRYSVKIMLMFSWEGSLVYHKRWNFHVEAGDMFRQKFPDNFQKRIQSALDYRASHL
jgi:hypothetical protein